MSFAISQEDVKGLNDDQTAAIFDALVAAAWADGTVSQVEKDRFEAELTKLPWGKPPADLVKMVTQSVEKVAAIKDRDGVMRFIAGVADRLTDQGLREKVLYTMGVITFADKEMTDSEKNVMKAFTESFKIPMDRAQAIAVAIRGGN
jgi:uncharacterized tellurite resistance protein B-like protein